MNLSCSPFYHIVSTRALRLKTNNSIQYECPGLSDKKGYYAAKDSIFEIVSFEADKTCVKSQSDYDFQSLRNAVDNDEIKEWIYFHLYVRDVDENTLIGFDPNKHKSNILKYLDIKIERNRSNPVEEKTSIEDETKEDEIDTRNEDQVSELISLINNNGTSTTADAIERYESQKYNRILELLKQLDDNDIQTVLNEENLNKTRLIGKIDGALGFMVVSDEEKLLYIKNLLTKPEAEQPEQVEAEQPEQVEAEQPEVEEGSTAENQPVQIIETKVEENQPDRYKKSDFNSKKTYNYYLENKDKLQTLDEKEKNKKNQWGVRYLKEVVKEYDKQNPVVNIESSSISTFIEAFDTPVGETKYLKNKKEYEIQVVDQNNLQIKFDKDSALVIKTLEQEANIENMDGWEKDNDRPYVVKDDGSVRAKGPNETLTYRESKDAYLKYDFCNDDKDPKYILKKIDFGNFKNFSPSDYQYHSLKYSGNKILLAHNPGFGKTINAILMAMKFRNQEANPPKILIIAPDKTVLRQWVEEVKRLFPDDVSAFFWCTYKHFELCQTNLDYPEWEDLVDTDISNQVKAEMKNQYQVSNLPRLGNDKNKYYIGKKIGDSNFLKKKSTNGFNNLFKLPSSGHPSIKDQQELRFCEICRKGRKISGRNNKENWKNELYDVDWNKLKAFKNTISHVLDDGKKTTYDIKWRLQEDKMFLVCQKCIQTLHNSTNRKGLFWTGFTSVNKTWSGEEKKLIYLDYFQDENDKYDEFLDKLQKMASELSINTAGDSKTIKNRIIEYARKTKKIQKVIPTQIVNYMFDSKFGKDHHLHMYRPPKNCILIADEVHTQTCVGGKLSLILQALWKYSNNTKYTIFCTATPLSASNLFLQMYTLSKMLSEGEGDSKYPDWSIQGIIKGRTGDYTNLKNIFQAAELMKYKISKFNTVDDIEVIIDNILSINDKDKEWIPNKKKPKKQKKRYKFYIEHDKLLNAFVGNSPYQKVTTIQMDANIYLKKALERIFIKQNNTLQNDKPKNAKKAFPSVQKLVDFLIPFNYYQQCLTLYQPKRLIDDVLYKKINNTKKFNIRIVDKTIVVTDGDTYSSKDLKYLEMLILNNYTDSLYTFYCQPIQTEFLNHDFGTHSVFQNQTQWDGLNGMSLTRNMSQMPEFTRDVEHEGLKYLYLHPVSKKNDYNIANRLILDGTLKVRPTTIPYIPDLETSKIQKITHYMERQYHKSKNFMVYFKDTNPSKALMRNLLIRKHHHIQKINDFEIEVQLEKHALDNALRRWRKWFVEGIDEQYDHEEVWKWVLKQDLENEYICKMIKEEEDKKTYKILHDKTIKTFSVDRKLNHNENGKNLHKEAVKDVYDQWISNNDIYIENLEDFDAILETQRKRLDYFTYCKGSNIEQMCKDYPVETTSLSTLLHLLIEYIEFYEIVFEKPCTIVKNYVKELHFICDELIPNTTVVPIPDENKLVEIMNAMDHVNTELDLEDCFDQSFSSLLKGIKEFVFYKVYSKRRKTEQVFLYYFIKKGDGYKLEKSNQYYFQNIKEREFQKYNDIQIRENIIQSKEWKDQLTKSQLKRWNDRRKKENKPKIVDNYVYVNGKVLEVKTVKSKTTITGLTLMKIYSRGKVVQQPDEVKTNNGSVKNYIYINDETSERIINGLIQQDQDNRNERVLVGSPSIYKSEPVYYEKKMGEKEALVWKCQNPKIRKKIKDLINIEEPNEEDKLQKMNYKWNNINKDLENLIQMNITNFLMFFYEHAHPKLQAVNGGYGHYYLTQNQNLDILLESYTQQYCNESQNDDYDFEYLSKKYLVKTQFKNIITELEEWVTLNNPSTKKRALIKYIAKIMKRQENRQPYKSERERIIQDINLPEKVTGLQKISERQEVYDKLTEKNQKIEYLTYRKQILDDHANALADIDNNLGQILSYQYRLGKDMPKPNIDLVDLHKKYKYYFDLVKKYNELKKTQYNELKKESVKKKFREKYLFNLQGLGGEGLLDTNETNYLFDLNKNINEWETKDLLQFFGSYYCFKKNLSSKMTMVGSSEQGTRFLK